MKSDGEPEPLTDSPRTFFMQVIRSARPLSPYQVLVPVHRRGPSPLPPGLDVIGGPPWGWGRARFGPRHRVRLTGVTPG
jgi:hypothetical protein